MCKASCSLVFSQSLSLIIVPLETKHPNYFWMQYPIDLYRIILVVIKILATNVNTNFLQYIHIYIYTNTSKHPIT